MGTVIRGMIMTIVLLSGSGAASMQEVTSEGLEKNCLQCHKEQTIPSYLIYRRYLMKYSTPERIENAMFDYLKEPLQSRSIMPPQFFLKFPMKPPLDLDDDTLRREIRAYIEKFDIRKRLRLAE